MSEPSNAAPLNPDHARLLDELGGPTAVAAMLTRRCNLSKPLAPQAVSMWAVRGTIPWRWRLMLAKAANELGIEAPADFLGEDFAL